MTTLAQLCLLLIMCVPPLRGKLICDTVSCGEIDVRFPFGLNQSQTRGSGCSYPRFELRCDNRNRTMLSVAGASGDLVVKSIDYEAQTVKVNDPEGCLPKRFLHNLSVSLLHPPFTFDATVYDLITFFRCPSNSNVTSIPCLRDSDNSSSVKFAWTPQSDTSRWRDECEVISSALVPDVTVADLNDDVTLKWSEPACGVCASRSEVCGFTEDTSLEVGCFSARKSQGLSRSAKYGLTIGVGIPGLLCLTGVCCFMCSKFDVYAHGHRARPNNELPSSITTFPPLSSTMGLNGPEIEKLPKTVIGESGRLPNWNDKTCPICLSEYEAKEALRTIPECNHYFHAHCVDEWLKMNATCPLCRNSPDPSSTVTPSSSYSSIYSPLP
ncbi:hypothetical protein Fmac_001957 [Flemingia macrophylla]|uniref:RING-type E3 ubiquitin transferase n=1 Tax=Flemingia macrophylla TaxID=520843 RepID=A0ABD1NJX0_9FABA